MTSMMPELGTPGLGADRFQPLYPDEVAACLAMAERGDAGQALEQCSAYVAAHNEDGWGHDAVGLICCLLLRTVLQPSLVDRAAQAFLAAANCANTSPRFILHLSELYLASYQFNQALTVIKAGVGVFGPLPYLQAQLGLCLAKCDERIAARDMFQDLLKQNQCDARVWEAYARAMQESGEIAEAVFAIEGLLTANPAQLAGFGMSYAVLLGALGRATESASARAQYYAQYASPKQVRSQRLGEIERGASPQDLVQFWRDQVFASNPEQGVVVEAAKYFAQRHMFPEARDFLAHAEKTNLPPVLEAHRLALYKAVNQHVPRVAALAAIPPGPQRDFTGDVIVVRGAVETLTLEIIKHYRAAHPTAAILLSTWADTDAALLSVVAPYFDDVVLNQRPAMGGVSNINFQLACAVSGVARARTLGAQRIMVTRTDIAFLKPDMLAELAQKLSASLADKAQTPMLGHRLVVCDIYTQSVPLYQVSDIFCYGMADDVALFWASDESVLTCASPEVHLGRTFAKRAGRTLAYSFRDSVAANRDLYIVCDAEDLQLYWSKYPTLPNPYVKLDRAVISTRVWRGEQKP
ncbi:MAG: hypothetical protein JNM81_08265, partial [Rhodospirillaceae bacterium]|nr:hypothetical protein [Rhodospirillaceae bacterium]